MNRPIDKSSAIKRATSANLEMILGHAYPVLDHGFIRVIDYMGNDDAIVQAARVSYGSGTKSLNDDEGLIRYLMRHWHSTPFEMCEIKLHVKLPVFVARQWIRHRTANVNEYSARYSILDREFYIPEASQIAKQSKTNKQGREEDVDDMSADEVREILRHDANRAYDSYETMLDEEGYGVARELARMNLPANIYTQWYWKTDLHNLFHFLRLRADSHAQWEIRQYADTLCDLTQRWVPFAYRAFCDYRKNAVSFSAQEMDHLWNLVDWSDKREYNFEDEESFLEEQPWCRSPMSKREIAELRNKLRRR